MASSICADDADCFRGALFLLGEGSLATQQGLLCAEQCVTCPLNAAGVNPMITTESIAYMVGQGVAGKYRHLAGKRRGPVDIKYDD